jgi:hypothetical protein
VIASDNEFVAAVSYTLSRPAPRNKALRISVLFTVPPTSAAPASTSATAAPAPAPASEPAPAPAPAPAVVAPKPELLHFELRLPGADKPVPFSMPLKGLDVATLRAQVCPPLPLVAPTRSLTSLFCAMRCRALDGFS